MGLLLRSVREGGLSYLDTTGLAGDCVYGRMIGIDLFSFNNCALVVVGSLRSPVMEAFPPRSLRRGVDGCSGLPEDGVVGVATLLTEDEEEWPPSRDCDL